MRIGIHLLSLLTGEIGGMEQYVRNLIRHISKRGGHELFLFLNEHNAASFEEMPRVVKFILRDDGNVVKQIHDLIAAHRIDLYFCPLMTVEPRDIPIPVVVNMPDVQHEYYPNFFAPSLLQWRIESFQYSVVRADAILTLSQHAKHTIIDRYHAAPNKVFPVYLDADSRFQEPYNPELHAQIINKYKLPAHFGLYSGNTWPHKNHLALLKGVAYLRDNYNMRINLVFTGMQERGHPEVEEYILEAGLSSQVRFLGYIPQDEVPYIYRSAAFLAFPSLYEGFGLPLVEAMKTGTPIICSDRTSIPEVVGDAGLYFNPEEPIQIASRIIEVLDEGTRRNLIQKGLSRAQQFSWERTCEETLGVFEWAYRSHKAAQEAASQTTRAAAPKKRRKKLKRRRKLKLKRSLKRLLKLKRKLKRSLKLKGSLKRNRKLKGATKRNKKQRISKKKIKKGKRRLLSGKRKARQAAGKEGKAA